MIFLQIEAIIGLLSTKEATIVGILLAIIALLIWERYKVGKEHLEEKKHLRNKIAEGQLKLEEEYRNNTEEIKSLIEKYYTISTKVLETLNFKL